MAFLNEPLLLVPMHIDALAVGTSLPVKKLFQWTNLAPNFSKLGSCYQFGATLVGDDGSSGSPFDDATALRPGIHLHFQLPRAFSHGSQEGAGPLSFPPVPNRWLVQRFGQEQSAYKAWLIKSDAPTPDNAPGIPWSEFPKYRETPETPIAFKRIGSYTELKAPLADADERALVNLTVVGQGNPIFSAYYPACHSALGFHDPLTGVSKGSRVSYLVTGWFSAAGDDPLHTAAWRKGLLSKDAEAGFRTKNDIPKGALSTEQRAKLLLELRDAWFTERQWTHKLDANVEPPSRLLCHGLVRGITWQGEGWNYLQPSGDPGVFHDNAYRVAVGNTGGEALAALLKNEEVDQDLLTALQAGLLEQAVTAEALRYELHSRRFDGVQGGITYSIQPQGDRAPIAGTEESALAAGRLSRVIPRPLRDLLDELNQKQSRCDELWRRVEDCRWQVYALWYLWTSEGLAAFVEPDNRKKKQHQGKAKALEEQLTAFRLVLRSAKTALDAARNDRDEYHAVRKETKVETGKIIEVSTGKIIEELAKYPKTQADGSPRLDAEGQRELKYRLVTSTAPAFYRPSEPVLAVDGPAMARLYTAEPSGRVACRLLGEIVAGFALTPEGGASQTITGEQLLGKLFPQGTPVLDSIHRSLLAEALLLDEERASNIAGFASEQQHRDKLTNIVKALQNPASMEAQAHPAPAPNKLVGTLPDSIASFNWQRNPWIPLLLAWEVSWRPDYVPPVDEPLKEDLVASRWRLDRSGDLARDDAASASAETRYQGYSMLTPSASRNLANRLKELNASHPLIDTLKNQRTQLQRLVGFNSAAILQRTGLQIPPLDFSRWLSTSGKFFYLDPIHADLIEGFAPAERRDRFQTAPDAAGHPFLPIRAGQLRIERLSIVDAFGQTLKLPVAEINASAGKNGAMLSPAHSCVVPSAPGAITLRPRIAQPSRLRFQWANGSGDPGTNGGPVCGWILPNHLEKSLTVYAADGKPLGALQQKLDLRSGTRHKTGFHWVGVPGVPSAAVPDPLTDLSRDEHLRKVIQNEHLRHFCRWVWGLSPGAGGGFSTLLSEALAATDQRNPDEDPGVSVLVGRPLVLVRASLQIETAGLPAHRPELRVDTVTRDRISALIETDGLDRVISKLIETNGFEKVKWPLRLGDFKARNDGLIGLFLCSPVNGGTVVTSGAFHPAWGQDGDDSAKDRGVEKKSFARQDFFVDCVQPLEVTMLMDPQARVHATTGAWPRTYIELPAETAAGAYRARQVFFQTAPVLGFSATPEMPRPSDDYGEWSWAHRPDVALWKLDPNLVEATERGGFADAWPMIAEGWLKLEIAPVKLSFWLREPIERVTPGTAVRLAWSLQGAESLELVEVAKSAGAVQTVDLKPILKWDGPSFPSEYSVTVNADTTYRVIASAKDAQVYRELTVKVEEPRQGARS